jgi:uncharacterized protein YqgC (DUF456 family)
MTTEQIIGLSLALLVMLLGLIGCIVPGLPGTPLVLAAAVGHRLYFGEASISNLVLIILIVFTLVSLLFDFLAGMIGARKFGATWRGALGAVIGGIVGLFFGLPGIILGPFVGAVLLEMLGGREFEKAAKAGAGATLGLLLGVVGKFSVGVVMTILFTANVILRSVN